MAGQVPPRIILMHKGTIDSGYRFQNVLQALSQIVAVSETGVLVEHDVHFDVEFVAGVVGLQALDPLDGLGEAHGEVEEHVALIGRGGCSCQVANVPGRRTGPVDDYVDGEEETAEGVQPP